MGKLQDSAKVIFPLSRAKLLCPDVEEIKVWREPRGVDGWAVLIRYADDTYASFSIDNGGDMLRLTEQAIVKQLEHHENLKRVIE